MGIAALCDAEVGCCTAVHGTEGVTYALYNNQYWPCDVTVNARGAAIVGMKAALRDAEMVTLQRGQSFEQRSTLVLMSGTLQTTGWTTVLPPGVDAAPPSRSDSLTVPPEALPAQPQATGKKRAAGSGGGGGSQVQRYEVEVQFTGPAVLPWLWEDEVRSDGEVLRRHAAVSYRCSSAQGSFPNRVPVVRSVPHVLPGPLE